MPIKQSFIDSVLREWREGYSERKIAARLEVSRRRVIDALAKSRAKHFKKQTAEHTIANLYQKNLTVPEIKARAKKQGINAKQFHAAQKKIPHLTLSKWGRNQKISKTYAKKFYKQIGEKIKSFDHHNFKFYIYGKFKKRFQEKYKPEDYEEPSIPYFQIGVNAESDLRRFLKQQDKLKSFRCFDTSGKIVSLSAVKRAVK